MLAEKQRPSVLNDVRLWHGPVGASVELPAVAGLF